jgi:hypothetical protein
LLIVRTALDVTSFYLVFGITILLLTIINGDTVGFASSGISFVPCSVKITVAVKNVKSWERQTAL